jgi:hypothetical protein
MGTTTDPDDPRLSHGTDDGPVPQSEAYLVLSEAERAQGFVRPLRRSYRHAGTPAPRWPLRELTPDEAERYAGKLRSEHDIGLKKMPCSIIGPRGNCTCRGYRKVAEEPGK